jgi:CRISPR-associated protein (TIGR02710 family)
MDESRVTLLICTVGGSPEPVVAAVKHWRPARIRFVHTPQTEAEVEAKIVPKANEEGLGLDAGRYEPFRLPDGQDLASCLDKLRELTPEVEQWGARGKGFQVVVDYSGGTKVMSAALALQARQWRCTFSYVGGKERTKDGVGVVVSGAEQILHQANPWDALGHQAVEEFIVLFDQRAFVAAARVAEEAKKCVAREDRKRELSVLEQFAKAFDAWDRFDHQSATTTFKNVEKAGNDLRAVLGRDRAERVLGDVGRFASYLGELRNATPPSRHHVVDLLANAQRRREEGRIDDAVARLYRAIEALAQVTLKEAHGIESSENVPLDRLPEDLRKAWERKAEEGVVKLGLQDAYALLGALDNSLGAKFQKAKLNDPKSALTARNRSILAHGFERVSDDVLDRLWTAALDLANSREADLPSFPKLGEPPKGGA